MYAFNKKVYHRLTVPRIFCYKCVVKVLALPMIIVYVLSLLVAYVN